MKYVSLKKLFHMDERKCNEVYSDRFNSESTKRLGIVLENGYECFFVYNNELVDLLIKIYKVNSSIEKTVSSKRFPSNAENFMQISTLIEEIRSSNKMEGIYSTRKELKEMIDTPTPDDYQRFYGMVNKYQKLRREDFKSIETVVDIRKQYDEILLRDIVNEDQDDKPDGLFFRKNPVEISSESGHVIHRGLNDESKIIEMLDKALKILNGDLDLLIRVAIFHYLFEYTHPFYDGNGRMGRYLASLYLSSELNVLCAMQFSVACIHNRKEYYGSFDLTNDVRNKADLTVFIIQFLEIYLSGLIELKDHLNSTLNKYERILNVIDKNNDLINYNEKSRCILELILRTTLFGIDGVTNHDLAASFNISIQTVRNYINSLNKNLEIIKIDKSMKPYKYMINLDVINDLSHE